MFLDALGADAAHLFQPGEGRRSSTGKLEGFSVAEKNVGWNALLEGSLTTPGKQPRIALPFDLIELPEHGSESGTFGVGFDLGSRTGSRGRHSALCRPRFQTQRPIRASLALEECRVALQKDSRSQITAHCLVVEVPYVHIEGDGQYLDFTHNTTPKFRPGAKAPGTVLNARTPSPSTTALLARWAGPLRWALRPIRASGTAR